MAAMMEESIADLVPASTNSSEYCPEDARIESLLTEKLMSGHALLEAFCPSCNTPLVKKQSSAAADAAAAAATADLSSDPIQQPVLISSHSFEPPFALLPGIPYCVGCAAHVVMTEEDVRLLELCDSLKDRGMILVALGSDVETVRTLETNKTMDTEAEAAAAVQRIAARIQTTAAAQQQQQQQDADAPPANTTAAGTSTCAAPPAAAAPAAATATATDSEEPILPVSALFCGSTASRQMVAGSPTPPYQEEGLSMSSSRDAIAAADAALAMFSMDHEEEGVEADLGAHESFRAMAAKQEYDNDNHGDNHDVDDAHGEHKPTLSLEDEENDGDDEGTFGDTTVEETVTTASVPAVATDPVMTDPVIKGEETTSPPQEEEKKDEDEEDGLGDYSVRRDIATKVLGAKMLQGYTLKETCCKKCGMPLMEYAGELDCVVCPVLVKKAKKKLKAEQMAMSEESLHQAQEERRMELQREEEERMANEEKLALEAQRLEEERLLLQAQKEEQERILLMEQERLAQEEEKSLAILAEEEHLILAEEEHLDQEEHLVEEEPMADEEDNMLAIEHAKEEGVSQLLFNQLARLEEARLLQEQLVEESKANAEELLKEEAERAESAAMAAEESAMVYNQNVAIEMETMEQLRRREEEQVMLENRRLEEMEHSLMTGEKKVMSTSAGPEMRELFARDSERQRLEKQAMVKAAEDARIEAELETRRLAEEKRADQETALIAALEEEANAKTKAAEDAIARAKAAMEEVSSAKKHIIASTIAQAEAEAIAEAEAAAGMAETYEIIPSNSALERQRWDTLRAEGRAITTRRMLQGWVMTADTCKGSECRNAALLTRGTVVECVVCGGHGSGADGVYIDEDSDDDDDDVMVPPPPEVFRELTGDYHTVYSSAVASIRDKPADEPAGDVSALACPLSPTAFNTVEKVKEDFDIKRNLVSKEIGKKMMLGWTLLDGSCPHCVMPLMTDGQGGPDTCVLCGPLPLEAADAVDERTEPPAHMDHIDRTDSLKSAATRSDPPAMIVDDEDTYSQATRTEDNRVQDDLVKEPEEEPFDVQVENPAEAPEPEMKIPSTVEKTEEPVKIGLAPSVDKDESGEVILKLPSNFDPTDEASVRNLLVQLQKVKSDASSSDQKNVDHALVEGPAVITATQLEFSDEMSHITGISYAKRRSVDVPKSSTIHDDEIAALERELRLYRSSSVDRDTSGNYRGHSPASLPPRPLVTRSRTNSLEPSSGRSRSGSVEPLSPGARPPRNPPSYSSPRTGRSPVRKAGPPKPEDDGSRGTPNRGTPPRGMSRTSSANSLRSLRIPPLSPRVSGRYNPVVVGGPRDRDDVSIMSDSGQSRAGTVCSDALSTILDKIEDCKTTLETSNDVMEQVEMANLIEKLAAAAVSMKKLEDLGI